jgi:hypothetical protein
MSWLSWLLGWDEPDMTVVARPARQPVPGEYGAAVQIIPAAGIPVAEPKQPLTGAAANPGQIIPASTVAETVDLAIPAIPPPDRFDLCVEITLAEEGAYSNHPDDPGGATQMGITQATLAAYRGRPVTVAEVKALTRKEALAIYKANYWTPIRCGDLPPGVDLCVFDFGVNAGPGRSAKMLQAAAFVTADGNVGPVTLKAVNSIPAKTMIARLADRRLTYYRGLGTFTTFGRGWTARVERVTAEALRMAG